MAGRKRRKAAGWHICGVRALPLLLAALIGSLWGISAWYWLRVPVDVQPLSAGAAAAPMPGSVAFAQAEHTHRAAASKSSDLSQQDGIALDIQSAEPGRTEERSALDAQQPAKLTHTAESSNTESQQVSIAPSPAAPNEGAAALEDEPKLGLLHQHAPLAKREAWRKPTTSRDKCWLTMGTCFGSGDKCEEVHDSKSCLAEHDMAWGGPEIPSDWKRLDSKSPCFREPDGEIFCLPLLYSLAPPKSGTTDSYDRIILHPDVVQAQVLPLIHDECLYKEDWWCAKEPMFWSLGVRDNISLEDYASLYRPLAAKVVEALHDSKRVLRGHEPCAAAACVNDISADWSTRNMDINPWMLHNVVPEARLVAFLRDPVKRAESEYNYVFWHHLKGCPNFPAQRPASKKLHENVLWVISIFNDCLKTQKTALECWQKTHINRFPSCPNFHKMGTFVLRGLYSVYLSWFREAFPDSQFFVRRTEDLNFHDAAQREKSTQMLLDLFEFAGLHQQPSDQYWKVLPPKAAWSKDQFKYKDYYTKLLPETEAALRRFYEPYLEDLRSHFGQNLKWG